MTIEKKDGFNWKAQTIGFDMTLANSLAGKYCANPVESCEAAKIKRKGGLEALDKIELNNEHPAALDGVEQGLACMAMLGGH